MGQGVDHQLGRLAGSARRQRDGHRHRADARGRRDLAHRRLVEMHLDIGGQHDLRTTGALDRDRELAERPGDALGRLVDGVVEIAAQECCPDLARPAADQHLAGERQRIDPGDQPGLQGAGGLVRAEGERLLLDAVGDAQRAHDAAGVEGGDLGLAGAERCQLLGCEPGLSPGFGSVKVTLTDGSEASGILMHESEKEIELKTNDAEPLKIAVSRISKRQNLPSGMPPMGMAMSKKEIRDVIEFLANQKK
jgi:hypothetical protein